MDERRSSSRPAAMLVAVLLAGLLAACGGSSPDASGQQVFPQSSTGEPDLSAPQTNYPAKAIVVQDSLTTAWAHRRFFAYGIERGGGRVDVVGVDGNSTSHEVRKGDTFTADDVDFEVLDVVQDQNPGGTSTGLIVLLPKG